MHFALQRIYWWWIDTDIQTDSIKLSCIQFLVSGILALIMCLITEKIVIADILSAAEPILYAGTLSSGVAYTLQMVGQKYAEPAVASIVMSMESVIAVVAGALVLNEVLAGREIIGCNVFFLCSYDCICRLHEHRHILIRVF